MPGYFEKRKAEREKYEKENPSHKPTQSQLFIKIIVGGYLVYLAWQLYKGGALVNYTGWQLALMIAAMVLFVVFGVGLCVLSLKALGGRDFYDPNAPAASGEEETPEFPPEDETEETEE